MNHWFRVVLALSLPLIAITVLLISTNQANPRPSYQVAVEQYVAYRRSMAIPTLTIQQYVQARLPQNFRPEMSKNSFGNAIYYRTTQRYDEAEAQADVGVWPLIVTATTVPTLTRANYSGSMPIPYPPNDLWCAQLSSSDPAAPTVVVAGLHQDMYNSEWIVHEVTDPETVLPAIGCQFSTQ